MGVGSWGANVVFIAEDKMRSKAWGILVFVLVALTGTQESRGQDLCCPWQYSLTNTFTKSVVKATFLFSDLNCGCIKYYYTGTDSWGLAGGMPAGGCAVLGGFLNVTWQDIASPILPGQKKVFGFCVESACAGALVHIDLQFSDGSIASIGPIIGQQVGCCCEWRYDFNNGFLGDVKKVEMSFSGITCACIQDYYDGLGSWGLSGGQPAGGCSGGALGSTVTWQDSLSPIPPGGARVFGLCIKRGCKGEWVHMRVFFTSGQIIDIGPIVGRRVDCNPPEHKFGDMNFVLDGSQQVPPNTSTARGTGTIVVDTLNKKLHFDVTHNVLAEIGAHIHGPAPRGSVAPILFTLPSGTHKVGTWDYPQSIQSDILAGRTYMDIHSSAFPGGQIRGQIEPNTPQTQLPGIAPWGMAGLALMLLGGASFFMVRRRARG